jgi:cold shock protein
MEAGIRVQGVVKRFNSDRGWGFIQAQTGEELFVHYSAIQMDGYRTLDEGNVVEFEIAPGEKGPTARNVTILK